MHDECPLTIAEALSLQTPVVALAHGGPVVLCQQWEGARVELVRPGGPEATSRRMAEAVDRMLIDPSAPVATPLRPRVDFADGILAAYERAMAEHEGNSMHRESR